MIPTLQRVRGGYRIKTQDDHYLDVRPLLRLFRLVEIPVDEPHGIGRYWCYTSFEAAVLAGTAWTIDPCTEPVGWVRAGGVRI